MAGINLSVTKALDVLDLLGQTKHGLRLKDIAAQLDLPESTTHRLLASLADRGFVRQPDDHGVYTLGWKIVVLAGSLGSNARIVQTMRPSLERLVRRLGQTINLAVLSNDHVMYLDCQTPNNSLALYVVPGLTLPVHATGLGKVLLAHMPLAELEVTLDRLPFTALTSNTLSTPAALRDALEVVRGQGFAIDRGELRPDVSCVAAPVLDADGRARAAVSMTAPTAELPAGWDTTFPPVLIEITQEASQKFFGAERPALVGGVRR